MKERSFNLEARLIAFAVRVIRAPNYGEAQSAESRTDFTHRLKIVLKELRETRVWLLMIQQAGLIKPLTALDALLQETNELIAIFVTSLKTTAKGRG
jgi:four helix bundle protein